MPISHSKSRATAGIPENVSLRMFAKTTIAQKGKELHLTKVNLRAPLF